MANGLISLGDHEFRFGILVELRLVESLHAALGTNNLMAILIRLRLALTQIDGKDHAIVTRRTHDRGVPLTGYRLPCHDRPPNERDKATRITEYKTGSLYGSVQRGLDSRRLRF